MRRPRCRLRSGPPLKRVGRRLWLGLLIAGLCLSVAWWFADRTALQRAMASIRPVWLGLAMAALAAGYACRVRRWHRMLKPSNERLRWTQCAGPLLAGMALNNLLPLRAGDVMRAVSFQRPLGVPTAVLIASLAAERLLDVMALFAICAVVLTTFAQVAIQEAVSWSLAVLAAVVVTVLVLLVAFPRHWEERRVAAGGPTSTFVPVIVRRALRVAADALLEFRLMVSGGAWAALAAWTMLAWAFEGVVFWAVARSMPELPVPMGAWLALPLATLATMVPGGPGHVGTFDLGAMQAMTLVGNDPGGALAYALLAHLTLWAPVTAAGVGYLAVTARARA
ncbi:lysylphosphatidylglycerol synthase transmembrane domain-containing protein [Roseateles sp.]|uniref:lysylphosphatidylglycerol synthase transmembrane domain-containing protein n=1 Tax=Roseateles sp. TaxID=1971397 RepID=UPI003265A8EA